MTRRLICDVPDCGQPRLRWQRLCDRCYHRLPGEIRVALTEAKHERRTGDWQKLRRRAADFMALTPGNLRINPLPPERVFELNQRILGERSDA